MKNILILFSTIALAVSCVPSEKVTRVDPGTQTDLTGSWNDTDARMVAEEMISDVVSKPWLDQFNRSEGEPPVVIVGRVRNETMEHIDTEVFTKEMERMFVNTGKVTMVADSREREDVRDERADQQQYASLETTKKMAMELGADYMMIGNISSIVEEAVSGRQYAVFYTVNLELVDVETNQKVWIGNKKIKKLVDRKNFRG